MTEGNVFEGDGNVVSKEEKLTKTQKKYWKVNINGMTGNYFDYEAGQKFAVGDHVKFFGENSDGINPTTQQPIQFHNYKSIFKEEIQEEAVEAQPTAPQVPLTPSLPQDKKEGSNAPLSFINGAEFGMAANQALRVCIKADMNFESDEDTVWENYEKLTLTFFSKNKQIKDKLERGK